MDTTTKQEITNLLLEQVELDRRDTMPKYRISIIKQVYESWIIEASDKCMAEETYLCGDMVYDKNGDTEVTDVEVQDD